LIERFGQKMLLLRKQRGMSLQNLANALGYTGTAYLSRVETGQRQPSLELAIKLADLFGVTVDQLVRDELELDPDSGKNA